MEGMLTSNDPEPAVATVVRDAFGRKWRRWPEGYWLNEDAEDDPESWVKVAGNYGPVTLLGG